LTQARKSHWSRRGHPAEPTLNGLSAKLAFPARRRGGTQCLARSQYSGRPAVSSAGESAVVAARIARSRLAVRVSSLATAKKEAEQPDVDHSWIAECECLVDCTYRSTAGRKRVVI
jgi:hypothetical protein